MKRFLSFMTALMLVLSMIPATALAAEVTVYLDPVAGADTNAGTEAAPVKTVEAAYEKLSGASAGTIVLLDTLTLTAQKDFPESSIPVTITSKTGAKGITSGKNLLFHGPTTLENLTLTLTAASNAIFVSAEGHDLTVGEGVTTVPHTSGSTEYYFCLTGRYTAGSADGLELTVRSGTWRNIYAAGYNKSAAGDVTLTVTGGKVVNNIAPTYTGAVEGNVEMHLSGCTVQTNICGTPSGGINGSVDGNVSIFLLGGTTATNLKVTKTTAGKVAGKVTVTVDGDCTGIKNIVHGTSTGTAGSTALVLKSGVLATTPCAFDAVSIDIGAGKVLTLDSCTVAADTLTAAGTLTFQGSAALSAAAVNGSVSCSVSGTVNENHAYVSAPAGSSVLFPESTGITERSGLWGKWVVFDEAAFTGLVLRAASDVDVTLYTGYEDGSAVAPNYIAEGETTAYYYRNITGAYRYVASGEGYYTITKHIYMSEAEAAALTEVDATPGKMANTGWETDNAADFTDETNALCQVLTPQMREEYADVFTTPAFTSDNADHQMTTQAQMEDFIHDLDSRDDDLYIFSVGTTSGTNRFDIPIVFFTRTDLSEATCLEEAAALMGQDKPTVLYRAQVHGNEPSAGEGALAVIKRLDGAYGESVLDKINVCIIPRTNPDGSYNYVRTLENGTDPNRDNLRLTTPEAAAYMQAYRLIDPELVLDGHEYNVFVGGTSYATRGDVLVSVGFTPANGEDFQDLAVTMMHNTFDTMAENGLTGRYYSNALNGSDANVASSFTGRQGTLFMLLEVRGIGYGLHNYERRVLSHVVSAESAITYVAENADQVQGIVDAERQRIVSQGSTYDESDQVILSTSSSSHSELSRPIYRVYQDGTQKTVTWTPTISDVVERARIAPTAYVIPAGESYTETVLELMDKHGISYSFLPADSTVLLQQYTGTATEASLTEEKPVTFENGAYVFYKNQVRGITLSMLMEPDVTDVSTYKGTLAQRKIITPTDGLFPIYRYVHDLNEKGQLDLHKVVYLSQSAGADTNDGLTESTAVATVEAAYARLQSLVTEGGAGAVILLDTYTLPGSSVDFPACSFPVLLTSKTGAEGFTYSPTSTSQNNRYIAFNGETTLENITVSYTKTTLSCIKANGHKLTIGANVSIPTTNTHHLNLVGGTYSGSTTAASSDLTVRSGTWRNIYVGGFNVVLEGDATLTMTGGSVDNNIHAGYGRNINGDVRMYFENVTVGGGIYGGNANSNDVKGAVTITLGKGVSAASGVYAGSRTGGNVEGTVTVIADGVDLSAVPVYGTAANDTGTVGGAVLQLARDVESDITVDDSLLLDLNGWDITGTVTGENGTLRGIDSSATTASPGTGSMTCTGTVAAEAVSPANGVRYLALTENGVTTFHAIEITLTHVALKPDSAGIYYKGTYHCDDVLKEKIQTFGVAVSLDNTPGADFATETGDINLWTEFSKEDFIRGGAVSGVTITNIFKSGDALEDNKARGEAPIYGIAYMTVDNGITDGGYTAISDNSAGHSLYTVLQLMDDNWSYVGANQDAVNQFYTDWYDSGTKDWTYENIRRKEA